jgi:diaphanous 1
MNIPRLGTRLECMIFRRRLELDVEELRPELDILRNASRQVRGSARFKGVLQVRAGFFEDA